MILNTCRLALFVLLVVQGSGCGGQSNDHWLQSRPKTLKAEGVVLLQNAPLSGATVIFTPTQKGSKGSVGITDQNGRFNLTTFSSGDGAISGEYVVSVTKINTDAQQVSDSAPISDAGSSQVKPVASSIPEQYSDPAKSGLKATITQDGPNDFKFELSK